MNDECNLWITKNYQFLEKWCRIWSSENWSDLLSNYVLYLSDKGWDDKMKDISDQERIKYTNFWLRSNSKWSNSKFNQEIRVNNLGEQYCMSDDPIYAENHYLDIHCDSENDTIKEWLIDVYKTNGEELGDIMVKLRKCYLQLNTSEKVLYDLYFTNMLSMRKISDRLHLPLSSIFNMMSDLKIKIKELYG